MCKKERPYKQAALSPYGLLWENRGCSFTGSFCEKNKMHVWVPFSCTQSTLRICLGAIWNFSKGTGFP